MASAAARPVRRRILIVEDQAILGMELEFVLEGAGHRVIGIAVDTRQALGLAEATTPELAVVDINLKGVANVIRHFVPEMVKRKSGVIVNFSSGWGRSADAEFAPYCATKWAIEGLTQSLAQELPSGMAAIPLNPGIINTDMLRSSFGGSAKSYPSPEEWVKVAVPFLIKIGPGDNGKQLTVPMRGATD